MENSSTGFIGLEYLIFKYRLNIYSEHFHSVKHNLLALPGSKLKDIKYVRSHAQAISQCQKIIKQNDVARTSKINSNVMQNELTLL